MDNVSLGNAEPLGHRLEAGADAAQVAEAVVSTWQAIDTALTPIIGQRGVASLYHRSLHLTAPVHSWLAGMHSGAPATMDLDALKSTLSQQDGAIAAAGGGALLLAFHVLLTSLIGPSLTERLLHTALTYSSNNAPPQDSPP